MLTIEIVIYLSQTSQLQIEGVNRLDISARFGYLVQDSYAEILATKTEDGEMYDVIWLTVKEVHTKSGSACEDYRSTTAPSTLHSVRIRTPGTRTPA